MAPAEIQQRIEQFQKRCEQRKINWREHVKRVPDDPRPILAGLATLLNISIHGAFDPSRSLDDLENESKSVDEEANARKE
jgi:hypothetical protein